MAEWSFEYLLQREIIRTLIDNLNISTLLPSTLFSDTSHKKIASLAKEYHQNYQTIPTKIHLRQMILSQGQDENSLKELEEVFKIIPVKFTLDEIYKNIRFNSTKQLADSIIKLVGENSKTCLLNQSDVMKIFNEADKIAQLENTIEDNSSFLEIVDEWILNRKEEDIEVIPTFSDEWNGKIKGGKERQTINVVSGFSGHGKSMFLINIALAATFHGYNSSYYSLELSKEKITERCVNCLTGMTGIELRENPILARDRMRIARATMEGDLYIKFLSEGNVYTIKEDIKRREQEKGIRPDLIVIDYGDLLTPLEDNEKEYIKLQKIFESMRKHIALEENVVLWTATQLNQMGGVAGAHNKRFNVDYWYRMALIKESEEDNGEAMYKPYEFDLECEKARNDAGEWKIKLFRDRYKMLMADLPKCEGIPGTRKESEEIKDMIDDTPFNGQF